jgi:hypothetical protein
MAGAGGSAPGRSSGPGRESAAAVHAAARKETAIDDSFSCWPSADLAASERAEQRSRRAGRDGCSTARAPPSDELALETGRAPWLATTSIDAALSSPTCLPRGFSSFRQQLNVAVVSACSTRLTSARRPWMLRDRPTPSSLTRTSTSTSDQTVAFLDTYRPWTPTGSLDSQVTAGRQADEPSGQVVLKMTLHAGRQSGRQCTRWRAPDVAISPTTL